MARSGDGPADGGDGGGGARRHSSPPPSEEYEQLRAMLLTADPNDDRDVVVEIRAGTGGDEAALFACGPVPHVLALRGASALAHRGARPQRDRRARLQGDRVRGARAGRVLAAQVRVRRAPRAARAGDRGAGAHPHIGSVGGRAPRGGRRRGGDQRERPEDRRLSQHRPGRSERQHHRLGGAHHASADRARGHVPGREVADQEPSQGDARAARAPLRPCRGEARRGAARRRAGRWWAAGTAARRSARTTSRSRA